MNSTEFPYNFIRPVHANGIAPDGVQAIIDLLAREPGAGVVMPGTGGCRKLRIGGRGKGKSGGDREIFFFHDHRMPIFLITWYGKGEKDNLTQLERNKIAVLTARLVEAYQSKRRVTGPGRRR